MATNDQNNEVDERQAGRPPETPQQHSSFVYDDPTPQRVLHHRGRQSDASSLRIAQPEEDPLQSPIDALRSSTMGRTHTVPLRRPNIHNFRASLPPMPTAHSADRPTVGFNTPQKEFIRTAIRDEITKAITGDTETSQRDPSGSQFQPRRSFGARMTELSAQELAWTGTGTAKDPFRVSHGPGASSQGSEGGQTPLKQENSQGSLSPPTSGFQCPIPYCTKDWQSKHALWNHIEQCHAEQHHPFSLCPVCGHRFSGRYQTKNLKTHLRGTECGRANGGECDKKGHEDREDEEDEFGDGGSGGTLGSIPGGATTFGTIATPPAFKGFCR